MNQNDVNVIYSMFPCLERIVEARFGLIGVLRLVRPGPAHNQCIIKLAMMKLNYACVNSFDTGGVMLIVGRHGNGEIWEEVHTYRYEPDEHFRREWRLENNLKICFMNWWYSVLDVFDAQKFAFDFVNSIRMELVFAVINRETRLHGVKCDLICE